MHPVTYVTHTVENCMTAARPACGCFSSPPRDACGNGQLLCMRVLFSGQLMEYINTAFRQQILWKYRILCRSRQL